MQEKFKLFFLMFVVHKNKVMIYTDLILSDSKLKVIDTLLDSFPDIVFGGSIALNALGLINRPVGDIDVFYRSKAEFTDWLKQQELNDPEYQNDVDMLGFVTHRIGAKIKGVKICGFEIPEGPETASIPVTIQGRVLQVQNPVYAIVAKTIYSEKTPKHKNDLAQIQIKLLHILNYYHAV